MRHLAVLAVVCLCLAPAARADDCNHKEIFRKTEKVAAGTTVRLRNLNGSIEVIPAKGDELEVVAIAHYKKGDPSTVKVERAEGGGAIAYCVFWPADKTTCGADGTYRSDDNGKHANRQDDDGEQQVGVTLQVRLPAHVKLDAMTVNGRIQAATTDDTEAVTVNGRISLQVGGGAVQAASVNGRIDLWLTGAADKDAVELKTLNGRIDVRAPKKAGFQAELSTQNGRIDVPDAESDESFRGPINGGGRPLRAKTQNGRISIHLE